MRLENLGVAVRNRLLRKKESVKSEMKRTPKKPKRVSAKEQETFYLICTEAFSNSMPKERWVQCIVCHSWSPSPQGSHSPYILGDTTRPGHVPCVLVWSKSDRRRLRKTLHKQTDRQTERQINRHYENNGHLAVNQKNFKRVFLNFTNSALTWFVHW